MGIKKNRGRKHKKGGRKKGGQLEPMLYNVGPAKSQ
jgi:hypothetical protein